MTKPPIQDIPIRPTSFSILVDDSGIPIPCSVLDDEKPCPGVAVCEVRFRHGGSKPVCNRHRIIILTLQANDKLGVDTP